MALFRVVFLQAFVSLGVFFRANLMFHQGFFLGMVFQQASLGDGL